MRRRGDQLTLSTEHRAAASQDHIPLQLTQTGSALALSVASDSSIAEPDPEPSALQRVHQILAGQDQTRHRAPVAQTLRSAHRHSLLLPGSTGR